MGHIGYQELVVIVLIGAGCAAPVIVAIVAILVVTNKSKKSKQAEQTPPKTDDPGTRV